MKGNKNDVEKTRSKRIRRLPDRQIRRQKKETLKAKRNVPDAEFLPKVGNRKRWNVKNGAWLRREKLTGRIDDSCSAQDREEEGTGSEPCALTEPSIGPQGKKGYYIKKQVTPAN